MSHFNTTHGKRYTKLYNIWRGMKKRCSCKNRKDYIRYGGRGVRVQENWVKSYEDFEKYVTSLESYDAEKIGGKNGLSLDRIDNNGDYAEGNLRWATKSEQAINRGMMKNNTTGYKGVTKSHKGFRARIQIKGERVDLGSKPTALEAHQLILDFLKNN